ncbi:MAG: hypothetical protein NVSMB55_24440 [Mycobacteriales bacterium]
MTAVSPTASGPTALDIITLGIAVAGLVVAMIGLTWQVLQHRLTGSVVVVELLAGALGRGGAATGPIDTFDASMFASQGFTTPILAIRGRNRGRLAVDVTGWDVLPAMALATPVRDSDRTPRCHTALNLERR